MDAHIGMRAPGASPGRSTLPSCMERSTWTDERLDDMAARNESQFELLRTEMSAFRAEMQAEFRDVRGELRETRRDMFHGAIALFGSQVAIFAVLLAQSL